MHWPPNESRVGNAIDFITVSSCNCRLCFSIPVLTFLDENNKYSYQPLITGFKGSVVMSSGLKLGRYIVQLPVVATIYSKSTGRYRVQTQLVAVFYKHWQVQVTGSIPLGGTIELVCTIMSYCASVSFLSLSVILIHMSDTK